MKSLFTLVALASLTALPLAAQERATGQGNAAQVNWSALSSQLNTISSSNKVMASSLGQIQTCSALSKIFVGIGQAGADASGCKSIAPTLSNCYQRGGNYGVHVTCNPGEVVTKVCSAGRDADCIAPGGTVIDTGQSAHTIVTSQATYTVLTCCKMADTATNAPVVIPPVVTPPVVTPPVTNPWDTGNRGGNGGNR